MALIIHPSASQGLALWYGASEADLALEHSSDTLTGLLSLANYLAFLSLSLITCKVRVIQLLETSWVHGTQIHSN